MPQFEIISTENESTVVAVVAGELKQAHSSHPNYTKIVEGLKALDSDEQELLVLFDTEKAVVARFEQLSERVSVANGTLFFDGDEVNDTLASQVLRFLDEGVEDWKGLVLFWEKLATNPNEHSREQLFNWLNTHKFTITAEGDVLGYKGLRDDSTSITAGPAVVDGQAVNGNVPNHEGSVVTMARSSVEHNPARGCSTGLHVGTFEYAKGFSRGLVREVYFNPRDVVSVPTDCYERKLRTSRYVVGPTVEFEYATPTVGTSGYNVDEYEDDEDRDEFYCPECGDYVGYETDECVSCEQIRVDEEAAEEEAAAEAEHERALNAGELCGVGQQGCACEDQA